MSKPKGKDFDWKAIRRDYEANAMSNRALGVKYGPSEATIRKRADKEKWTKDLSGEVRQATKAKLSRDVKPPAPAKPEAEMTPAEREAYETEVVQHAAAVNVEVIRLHRKDISQLLAVGREVLDRIRESVQPGAGEDGQAQPMKPGDVRSVAQALANASTAFHKAIVLERQAFNIDDGNGEGESAGGKIKLPGLTILIDGPGSTDAGDRG